jgi:hypothetical protein|tara:strand:+ start:1125 stop:1370 length:246 start_codon:yes stop_codon:yes gene_type:complete
MARTSKEKRINKGNAAEKLFNDPLIQEVFEKMETSYNNAWVSSGLDDIQKRETLFLSIRALSEFKLELESMIMGGKIAQKE